MSPITHHYVNYSAGLREYFFEKLKTLLSISSDSPLNLTSGQVDELITQLGFLEKPATREEAAEFFKALAQFVSSNGLSASQFNREFTNLFSIYQALSPNNEDFLLSLLSKNVGGGIAYDDVFANLFKRIDPTKITDENLYIQLRNRTEQILNSQLSVAERAVQEEELRKLRSGTSNIFRVSPSNASQVREYLSQVSLGSRASVLDKLDPRSDFSLRFPELLKLLPQQRGNENQAASIIQSGLKFVLRDSINPGQLIEQLELISGVKSFSFDTVDFYNSKNRLKSLEILNNAINRGLLKSQKGGFNLRSLSRSDKTILSSFVETISSQLDSYQAIMSRMRAINQEEVNQLFKDTRAIKEQLRIFQERLF